MLIGKMLLLLATFLMNGTCVTINRDCGRDEAQRSCAFYEEYICWVDKHKLERVKTLPKKLIPCRASCHCRTGFVRAFVNGSCIEASRCKDRRLEEFIRNLPKNTSPLDI